MKSNSKMLELTNKGTHYDEEGRGEESSNLIKREISNGQVLYMIIEGKNVQTGILKIK